MTYNYLEELKKDITDYIGAEIDPADYFDREELEEHLNDELWTVDSVTGNGSGSYTFSTATAREHVMDNIDLLKEAYEDLCCKDLFADQFFGDDWETMDVTIRCHLLSAAISEALDDIEDGLIFGEDIEDNDAAEIA